MTSVRTHASAALALLCACAAFAAPPGGGSSAPTTVFAAAEVAPEELSSSELQAIVVTLRNTNADYDGATSPKLLQAGDRFTVVLGSACVSEIRAVTVTSSLPGGFTIAPALPSAGASFSLTYQGPASAFTMASDIRARVTLTAAILPGDCTAPLGSPTHPGTLACAASVGCTSSAG